MRDNLISKTPVDKMTEQEKYELKLVAQCLAEQWMDKLSLGAIINAEERKVILNDYQNKVNELEEYMKGNVAEGFTRDETAAIKGNLAFHNNMKDLEKMLTIVIEQMKDYLIAAAKAAGTPILCSMGTGNKLDATKFQITDISKTSVCPLARVMRKECAKRSFKGVKVLFSTEDPILSSEASTEELPEGRRSLPGSVAFVPSVAGLLIAGEVIKDLIQ